MFTRLAVQHTAWPSLPFLKGKPKSAPAPEPAKPVKKGWSLSDREMPLSMIPHRDTVETRHYFVPKDKGDAFAQSIANHNSGELTLAGHRRESDGSDVELHSVKSSPRFLYHLEQQHPYIEQMGEPSYIKYDDYEGQELDKLFKERG